MNDKFLYNILKQYYDIFTINKIYEGYNKKRYTTIRVNTIKSNMEKIKTVLNNKNIKFLEVPVIKTALIIKNVKKDEIKKLDIYKNGEIYIQSLSSMLPPIILQPKEEERILDMTAAPGGKTCEIACITNNNAYITAVEKNKIRCDRLKYNLEMQGVKKYNVLNMDAKDMDDLFSFDKILLDSPCSGSGTINIENISNFSEKLLYSSIKIQEELLNKAIKLLKPGSTMVYSTCSILKEENEDILNKVLIKNNAEIVPIDLYTYKDIPLLPVTIKGTMCVCPTELYEGFFIAKIIKK